MTYSEATKAVLDASDNWSSHDDGKPLDFVIASALSTFEARTFGGPWVIAGEPISRDEYVAHRVMAVVERTGALKATAALARGAIDTPARIE